MSKALKTISFDVYPSPPSGAATRLESAFSDLALGDAATYTLPAWTGASMLTNGYTDQGFRDLTNKRVRWLTKDAAKTVSYLHQYDEVTDTFSLLHTGNVSDPANSGQFGHPYSQTSMNYENGDFYFMPWDEVIRKFANNISATWVVQNHATTPWTIYSMPIATTYSKNLYGTGNPGFVIMCKREIYGHNLTTGVVTKLLGGVPTTEGNHPTALTLPDGSVICSIGRGITPVGDSYQHPSNTVTIHTYKITGGTTPTVTRIQDAPSPTAGYVGCHVNADVKILGLGTRVFAFEGTNDVFTGTRAWELIQGSLAFPEWVLTSWPNKLRFNYPTRYYIPISCHEYGGFLTFQGSGAAANSTINASIWKPPAGL